MTRWTGLERVLGFGRALACGRAVGRPVPVWLGEALSEAAELEFEFVLLPVFASFDEDPEEFVVLLVSGASVEVERLTSCACALSTE